MPQDNYVDPEDMFSDTRMSFGDHIEELRTHLIRAGVGFLIGMVFSLFFLAKPVLDIISAPVKTELFKYQLRTLERKKKELEQLIKDNKGNLRPFSFNHEVDARALLPFIREELGLPAKQDERVDFEPLLQFFEDAAHDLRIDLGRDSQKPSHWVTLPVQIADPERYIKALQELKPYIDPPSLKTFTITETFVIYFKVAMLTGLVVTSPWVFYQVWMFIAAGLYPHEKKLVNVYLPFSLGLFLAGVVLCQVFVIPKAIEALLWFNEWLGYDPELRLSDWLGFAIMMPLVFGISFQTPLVMMFLNKVGIIEVDTFRNRRKMAWFIMCIFAAVITPTVDAISMLLLWVPMGFLYELGILLCVWQSRNEFKEIESSENEDQLIEV